MSSLNGKWVTSMREAGRWAPKETDISSKQSIYLLPSDQDSFLLSQILQTKTLSVMSIHAGFDMVPCLGKGLVEKHNWQTFIDFVKKHYKDDECVEVKPNYIEFKTGEHPLLPFEGHKFLRFSCKISTNQDSPIRWPRILLLVEYSALGGSICT